MAGVISRSVMDFLYITNVQPMNGSKIKAPHPISFFGNFLRDVGNEKIGCFLEVSIPILSVRWLICIIARPGPKAFPLYSEDLPDGQVARQLRIRNPFA